MRQHMALYLTLPTYRIAQYKTICRQTIVASCTEGGGGIRPVAPATPTK